jgi:hypothetical protein
MARNISDRLEATLQIWRPFFSFQLITISHIVRDVP